VTQRSASARLEKVGLLLNDGGGRPARCPQIRASLGSRQSRLFKQTPTFRAALCPLVSKMATNNRGGLAFRWLIIGQAVFLSTRAPSFHLRSDVAGDPGSSPARLKAVACGLLRPLSPPALFHLHLHPPGTSPPWYNSHPFAHVQAFRPTATAVGTAEGCPRHLSPVGHAYGGADRRLVRLPTATAAWYGWRRRQPPRVSEDGDRRSCG